MNVMMLAEGGDARGGLEAYVVTESRALEGRGARVKILYRAELGWSDEHDAPSEAAAERVTSTVREMRPNVIALHNVLDAAVIRAAQSSAARTVYHLHDHRLFCPNGDRVYPRSRSRCGVVMGNACLRHAVTDGCAYGARLSTLRLLRMREATAAFAAACDAVIVFSNFMWHIAMLNGMPRTRTHVIAPPLAPEFFSPIAARPDKRSVLFSGRVQPVKGLVSLVRAVGSIAPQTRPSIVVAGEGPALEAARREAQSRGCEFIEKGTLDRDGVIRALDACAIAAMPSLWDEPFGLSGIEAFARGRPVAAFATGAIPEWIADGGIAVQRGDEGALARAVSTLLENDRWDAFSANARRCAEQYTIDAHLRELLAVYDPFVAA